MRTMLHGFQAVLSETALSQMVVRHNSLLQSIKMALRPLLRTHINKSINLVVPFQIGLLGSVRSAEHLASCISREHKSLRGAILSHLARSRGPSGGQPISAG